MHKDIGEEPIKIFLNKIIARDQGMGATGITLSSKAVTKSGQHRHLSNECLFS